MVDDIDFDWLSSWKWCSDGRYAVRGERHDGRQIRIYMHRSILNPPAGMETDHINGNKFDNRRSNLRAATKSQNMANAKPRSDRKTGRRGVLLDNRCGLYVVRIKGKHLGCFADVEKAYAAYCNAAIRVYGDFARLD